jgi:leader peptidase (prepilin peptidase)/N-methyltransferase
MHRFKQKTYPWTVLLSLITMLIILEAFDNSIMIIKGFLFAQILIFAGYHDVKTKVIPDFVHIIIALVSIINIKPDQVALGLLVGMLPFLIIGIIFGGIGGGDIKLIGACGLVLGYRGIIVAGIIGLSIALLITFIFQRDKKLGIPLAPYLGVGCFISYLLQI